MAQNINQNLDELENSIVTAKTTLATNLSAKGVQTEPSVTLTEMANNVNNIPSGGGGGDLDFSTIGYTGTPQYLKDNLAYSQQIYDTWDANKTSLSNKFYKDTNLVWMPLVDTSKATDMDSMFAYSGLKIFPSLNTSKVKRFGHTFQGCKLQNIELDTSSCTDMDYTFESSSLISITLSDTSKVESFSNTFGISENLETIIGLNFISATDCYKTFNSCKKLKTLPQLNLINCTNMDGMFSGCESLIKIQLLNTSNSTRFDSCISECKNLERVEEFDFSSVTYIGSIFGYDWEPLPKLSYILIKNIGKSSLTTYDLNGGEKHWGDDTLGEGSKQSLIDSLITYSYDRKANGMEVATITLPAEVKARLTEEELASITAKGFTVA